MKSKETGTPVPGRGNLVKRRLSSKWSRRGCTMRRVLLAVVAVVRRIAWLARVARLLSEYF